MARISKDPFPIAALLAIVLSTGCSMRTLAVNQLGNALAAGGTTFASDDDPELVGGALPFSLKLMESLLAQSPEHTPLLVATSRGFTQYAYGWVNPAGDEEGEPAERARERSKRLYLRGRDYGMRALAASIDNFRVRFAVNPRAAVSLARKRDVPALYWTAAAWGMAIANGKDDMELLADLPLVEALILRAAELEPGFDEGAIDTFLISFEAARSGTSKEAAAHARAHFRRAVQLSRGESAAPFVAAAEALSIPDQNRTEFEKFLNDALAVDPDVRPEWRLQNILAQRRARWLLAHHEDLFIESETNGGAQ